MLVQSKLIPYLQTKVCSFEAGQISLYYNSWAALTSDREILQTVTGATFEFVDAPPNQVSYPYNSICKDHEPAIANEIHSLLEKKVITPCQHEIGEFISPIFSVPKPNGKIRLILNLKRFNSYIANAHFKMDNLHTVLKLVRKDCWMASIDLKDAYYSVKIDPSSQKFLKFCYKNQLYKFTAFPNGLSTCPRKFTKLLKPPLAWLRINGHIVIAYIDDLYLQGKSFEECMHTIIQTLKILESLGFVIHPDKSNFIPCQKLLFLGFVINSKTMTVTLTHEKIMNLKDLIQQALACANSIKIRSIAQIIGHIIASLPAVQYGALYYRQLDRDKTQALKNSRGNFDSLMSISDAGIHELKWWLENLDTSFGHITKPPVDIVVYSDASLKGWGAALDSKKTGGNSK